MYHPFVEGLALTLVDVPITLLTTIVFAVILYLMTGLQRTAVSATLIDAPEPIADSEHRVNSCMPLIMLIIPLP